MCSRYTLISPPDAVRKLFSCAGEADFPARYNIAPTTPTLIVRLDHRRARELALVRWGLIPPWVKDPRDFATLVNARVETAVEKPSFRGAIRHRRCLVPADGYYEWTGRPGSKQPHLIRLKGGGLLALGGLWEHWLGSDGSEIETMAVLTTAANGDVRHIHERMPLMIAEDDFERWLDCRPGTADVIPDLLKPAAEGRLEAIAVNPRLNNPRMEGPELIHPVAEGLG